MHSHLDIQIEGKSLALPDNFSISIEEQNPLFNDGSAYSYPVRLPINGNLSIMGNINHPDSTVRGMNFEHKKAKIISEGIPFRSGRMVVGDGSQIGDSFEFNIDSENASLSNLLGEMSCRDVDISDKNIIVGEKIGEVDVAAYIACIQHEHYKLEKYHYEEEYREILAESNEDTYLMSKTVTVHVNSPQAIGFSIPAKCKGFPNAERAENGPVIVENYINVSKPYPFPYCNSRVAYIHPGLNQETGETEGVQTSKETGSYWVLDANRQQSGLCFYVLYFLDCLFEKLGLKFIKDELLEIEDFKRLCFFTTRCAYDEIPSEYRKLSGFKEIQDWLSSRDCGGGMELKLDTGKAKNATMKDLYMGGKITFTYEGEEIYDYGKNVEEKILEAENRTWVDIDEYKRERHDEHLSVSRLIGFSEAGIEASVNLMRANSDNFPNVPVSTLIQSLENSFGIKFIYDDEKKIVTAKLLRNIYNRSKTRKFNGKVLRMIPVVEKTTGVRMAYSEESEATKQKENVRYGVKDYNTEYDYIDYKENKTITNKTYQQLVTEEGIISNTNMNVYIDRRTGNVYRVKIDGDADSISLLKPTLFRVAQYKGAEIGDCSYKNKEFVKEFISDFKPLTMNIVNASSYNRDTTGKVSPIFAPFLDVEMEHEFLEKRLRLSAANFGQPKRTQSHYLLSKLIAFQQDINLLIDYKLSTKESYDPTKTENGNSPLQEIDWGLTLCVMRGGGSGSEIVNYDYNYDGFLNSRWTDTVAAYAMNSDTMDPKGALFDYNGVDGGFGDGERFSLNIRSYVQPDWAELPICDDDERDDKGKIVKKILSRGLYDSFMKEHVYALLHRKKYEIECIASAGALIDVCNHITDKYNINGRIGYIDRVRYKIDKNKGVNSIVIVFFSI